MASDVLVSETAGAGANNEFDIMTSNNGDQVQDRVVVDLMASPSNNGISSDSDEKPPSTEPEFEPSPEPVRQEEEEEIVPEHVTPAKLLKIAMAENGNGDPEPVATNGDTNGHRCNGDEEPHENGNNSEPSQISPTQNEDGGVCDENGNHHHESVVVNTEETTTPEGGVVQTTTTTVVKVDETSEGDAQIVTTTVKTTTVSYQSSELVVEVGPGEAAPVEAHELAAIVESGEPSAEEKPTEEEGTKPAEEEKVEEAVLPAAPVKEAKQSTARRLFNFVRSPVKQKSVDDPTMAVKDAEVKEAKDAKSSPEKAKSPPHQRRLFGWRKTWTPEKGGEEKAEGEKPAEEGAEEKPERPSRGKKAKTSEEGNAEAIADQPAAPQPKQKKAKKSKKEEPALVEAEGAAPTSGGESAPSTEEKAVSPKKKLRLGLMKKSKSTTASPGKPEKTATEKWQAEKCAEAEPQQPTEHATPVSVLDSKPVTEEKMVAEEPAVEKVEEAENKENAPDTCAERPTTPLKEEAEKVVEEAAPEIAPAPTEGETPKKAEDVEEKKEEKKKEKKSSVRKSWTFRMNRSQTEGEKMASKSGKEAPAALHSEPQSASKQPFSPGKPFFSGFLHRKKKTAEPAPEKPAEQAAAVAEVQAVETPVPKPSEEEEPAVQVAQSMSMPQLTPEKHEQSASEKWAAEGCPAEPAALSAQDVVVTMEQPASTSKKPEEGSPMRRSASLRMPSSLSRFFRFLGPRHRNTTVSGALGEEAPAPESGAVTPPPTSQPTQNAPHTTSLTTPVSPRRGKDEPEVPASDSKTGVTSTPGRGGSGGGFRFWSTWRSSGGPSTFGKFRRKDKNATASHDDSSLIVNTSLIVPQKSATLHDMPRGTAPVTVTDAPTVDLAGILARFPPHSPNDRSPTYLGISRVLNGYAEYNSPTRRSGASSQASHKSPGGTVTATLDDSLQLAVEPSGGGSLLQPVFMVQQQQQTIMVCQTSEIGRDALACLATADAEQTRLEGRCSTARPYLDAPELTGEARGHIEATLGKTNLLLTQKFKQFRDLCHESQKPAVEGQPKPPSSTDLAGFWDLVLLQVHDLDSGFDAIEQMKQNGWQQHQQAPTNGTSQPPAEAVDLKNQKKKKKQEKSKSKPKTETEKVEAEAKAKSRFAEFKQRMFKGKDKASDKAASASADAAAAVVVTNGVEASATNGVNGETSATAGGVTVTVGVEEAKSS